MLRCHNNSTDSDSEEEDKNIIGLLSDDDDDDDVLIVKKNRDEYENKLQEHEEEKEEIPAWMRYLPKTGWISNTTTSINFRTNDNTNFNTNEMNIMKDKITKLPISSNRFAPSSKEKENMTAKRNNRIIKNDINKPYSSSNNTINKFAKSKIIRKSSNINETALLLSMHKIDK